MAVVVGTLALIFADGPMGLHTGIETIGSHFGADAIPNVRGPGVDRVSTKLRPGADQANHCLHSYWHAALKPSVAAHPIHRPFNRTGTQLPALLAAAPQSLPMPHLPTGLSLETVPNLLYPSFTIALLVGEGVSGGGGVSVLHCILSSVFTQAWARCGGEAVTLN